MTTSEIDLVTASVSVGAPGKGILQYDFVNPDGTPYSTGEGASPNSHWTGWISVGSPDATVVIKGHPTPFKLISGSYVVQDGSGSTLTTDGTNFTFTAHDGTVGFFTPITNTCPNIAGNCIPGLLTTLTLPSGEVQTFTYRVLAGDPASFVTTSVQSNLGYQLKFNYQCTDNVMAPHCFWLPTQVIAINNALEVCDPNANSCGLAQPWPTLTVSYVPYVPGVPEAVSSVTGPTGITTSFSHTYDPGTGNYSEIRTLPSSHTYTMSVAGATPSDMTISDGTGNWDYNFDYSSGVTVVTTITDPTGHKRQVVSDIITGQLTSDTTDPGGLNLVTQYIYDAFNRIQEVQYPENNYVQYSYDARGNIYQTDKIAKPGSGTATITTTASFPSSCASGASLTCNQPTSTTDADGKETDYTYNSSNGGVATITSPSVNGGRPVTQFAYQALYAWYNNGSGIAAAPTPVYELTQTTACAFPDSSAWGAPTTWGAYIWNGCAGSSSQRMTTVAFTAGNSSTATNLLPASLTTAAGSGPVSSTVSTVYDRLGNIASTSGPLSGQTTVYLFDFDHHNLGTIGPDPDGSGPLTYPATKITLDADGHPILTEQGTATSQSFATWPSNFSSPSLAQVTTTYNNSFFGLRSQQNTYVGGTTNVPTSVSQYSYNGARLPLCSAIRENPSVFGSLPDACTQSTTGSFGPDQISYNSYDVANRLSSVQAGYGTGSPITEVASSYTNNSKVSTVTDGGGHTSQYSYDGQDRLVSLQYPTKTYPFGPNSSDYEAYGYDGNGNILTHRLRSGQTITLTYDALNRVLERDDPAGGSSYVFYNYDFLGNLLYAHYGSANGAGIEYAYDALGRKITETSYGRKIASTYDPAGNRTSLTYPDGSSVGYSYDLLNRMQQITRSGGALATYSYDNLGRVTGISRGNSTSTVASYNGSSASWSMSQSLVNTSQNVNFVYAAGPAGQMEQRSIDNSAYAYSAPSASATYAPNGLNQYDSVNGTPYAYDGRGNITSDGARTFGYDYGNRLISVSGSASMTLGYDPVGRMQQTSTGGSTEQYLYDGATLIAEYDGSGNLLRRYVPGAGTDETAVWYEGSGFSSPHWLYTDERGSVIGASDASGSAATYNYSVTGEPGGGWGSSPPTPIFRYTGQATLSAVGLYYFKARMYDPALGRFLQTDPTGYDAGMNLYAYADNDPANQVDPNGLDCVSYDTLHDPACQETVEVSGDQPVNSSSRVGPIGHPAFIDPMQTAGPPPQPRPKTQVPNGTNNYPPGASCKRASNFLAQSANVLETISTGASYVSLASGGVALFTSETGIGGVTFGGISLVAGGISIGASGLAAGANWFAGRRGNAAVDAFAVGVGFGTAAAAKAVPPFVQLMRNGMGTVMSNAASSICPG